MLKNFNLVQHESTIKIKVLNCKGGTALRKYRLCFIVLCGLMDNFQHFYVTRPIWSVQEPLLWPASPLVTMPCPVLALFLNKLSLAVVQMLNFLNKS